MDVSNSDICGVHSSQKEVSHDLFVPPSRDAIVPPSCNPIVPSSCDPIVPPSCDPIVPPSCDPIVPPSREGISKKRLFEFFEIPERAFDHASNLCIGMQFESWDDANLVLLAYEKQIGFVWRIQDKYA